MPGKRVERFSRIADRQANAIRLSFKTDFHHIAFLKAAMVEQVGDELLHDNAEPGLVVIAKPGRLREGPGRLDRCVDRTGPRKGMARRYHLLYVSGAKRLGGMIVNRISMGLGLIAFLASAPAAAEIARIKQSSGTASIERAGRTIKASPGVVLETGDRLVTGKDGRISLTFVDNTRFALGPNSRVAVSQFEYDRTRQKGSFVTSVDRGSLAIVSGRIAKSGRDAMKVRTPNSLLGVRGTWVIVQAGK